MSRDDVERLGRCLTVSHGSDRPRVATDAGIMIPTHRSSGPADVAGRLGSWCSAGRGVALPPGGTLRETELRVVVEQALERDKPRRAPAVRPHPGQGRGRRANGLPGGAKLRSGRAGRKPASPAFTGSGGRKGRRDAL